MENLLKAPAEIKLDADKVKTWLKNGATPTDTARDLLAQAGIIEKTTGKKYKIAE